MFIGIFCIKNSSDVIPGCVNVDILAYLASIGAFNQYKVRAMGGSFWLFYRLYI